MRGLVDEDLFGEEALFVQLLDAGDADTYATLRSAFDGGLANVKNDDLSIIKAAIASLIRTGRSGEGLEDAITFSRQLLGISIPGDRLRVASGLVRGAVASVKRAPGDLAAIASMLRFRLRPCDERFSGLEESFVAQVLSEAANSTTSTGNLGRAKKGERFALTELMAAVSAFDASSIEVAQKKFDNAQDTDRQRGKRPVLRGIDGGSIGPSKPKG